MMARKNAETGWRLRRDALLALRAAGLRLAGGFFLPAGGRFGATKGGLRLPDSLINALPGVRCFGDPIRLHGKSGDSTAAEPVGRRQ